MYRLSCLADCHTHSKYSFDGRESIADMCESAISAGLDVLTVTDHCDIDDIKAGLYMPYDADGELKDIVTAREVYKNRLTILYGVELGQAHYLPDESSDLLKSHKYDFVLGSVHNLPDAPDFSLFKWDSMEEYERKHFLKRSFEEIRKIIEFPGICSAAHINYPMRYIRRCGCDLGYEELLPQITELMLRIIDKDIAIECNTSGWHKAPIPDDTDKRTLPDKELLSLYRSLGGTRLTIGSDAHRKDCIGVGIKESLKMLKEIGFDEITIYAEGKPNQIPIVIQ